ncbi:unnamed protein product [Arctia plantaginis]|uniref:FLYWCH-type domain-containing protein n=1 Tax=Arctia plantaginis TaxID=874455 RepID=A0A8S1AYR0_ARCPL|nr:unnamed protein product [Arctia plantaginis]
MHLSQGRTSTAPFAIKLAHVAASPRRLDYVTANNTIRIFSGPVITHTKRGTPLLQADGYRYNCKRKLNARTYWVCNKAPQGCRVSIVTYDDVIIKQFSPLRLKDDHVYKLVPVDSTLKMELGKDCIGVATRLLMGAEYQL